MSRKSALFVLVVPPLVLAVGLVWGVGDEGRTSQG